MPKPSLVPAVAAKPTVAPTVAVRVVHSPKLDRLLQTYQEIAAKCSQFEAQKKATMADITAQHARLGPKLDTGDFLATQVEGESTVLSKDILLSLGVTPAVIEAATKRVPYTYSRITRKSKERTAAEDEAQAVVQRRTR